MGRLKLAYDYSGKKRASTLVSLALSEYEATETLMRKELFREAVVHMYFTCFYLSQALLVAHIPKRASHKNVERALHAVYGSHADFPRRYVELHSCLHNLRTEVDYKTTHVPSPSMLKKKARLLAAYVKYAVGHVPQVKTLEVLREVYEANKSLIKDFSYDIYCPKTYSHHTRITFWQPPFYLDVYGPDQLATHAKKMLSSLKVRRTNDYVVGINSKLNQYKPIHLIMLDIDSLDAGVEAALKSLGGILLKTGRGLHFIGHKVVEGQKEWVCLMKKLRKDKDLKERLDMDHIDISLRRGYATLRVTASPVKPVVPVFFKEI